jgi:hypothetical protein
LRHLPIYRADAARRKIEKPFDSSREPGSGTYSNPPT